MALNQSRSTILYSCLVSSLSSTLLSPISTWLTRRSETIFYSLSSTPESAATQVKGPNGQLSRAFAFPRQELARNTLLFSLADVFLETIHSSALEALQRPIDLMNGQESPYTESSVARRLAKYKYSVMDPGYHKIVERLVECDFRCGNDLSSRQLQAATYNEVICQGLRKLCIGL